jgi:toxin ParE1/3/4
MAYRVIVMPSAQADLQEHTDYIALDSDRYAREWLNKAWDVISSLAENPKRFAVIAESEEIGVELRDALHYSHRIVYWVKDEEQVVEVLRVYHGARKPLTQKDIR